MTSLCMTYYPISNFEIKCDKNVNPLVLDESFILIIAKFSLLEFKTLTLKKSHWR